MENKPTVWMGSSRRDLRGFPREIRRKFDEIVAFSGIEEFIDTPVKRYSTGMNARLGFSIAAHLDPDVLIIEPKVFGDTRGFFFESYNRRRFQELTGYAGDFVQDNHSRSSQGTLRGLHYQLPPVAQDKLVRVTRNCLSLPVTGNAHTAARERSGHLSHLSAALHHGWEIKFPPDMPQVTVDDRQELPDPDELSELATVFRRRLVVADREGWATSPLRTANESDILASVGGRFGGHWTFDVTTQYNRQLQRGERLSTAVSYRPEPAKVLNASYRFQREVLEQFDISGQWPLRPGWYGVGRYNYSIRDDKLLEGLAGIEYNAGCWVFRGVVARIQASTEVSSTAFIFQIEFNGIGSIGTEEVVGMLRRNVPGYSVTNPADSRLAPPDAHPRLPFDRVY